MFARDWRPHGRVGKSGPGTQGVLFGALLAMALLIYPIRAPAQDSHQADKADPAVEEFRRQLRALNWVKGPQKVQLYDLSTLQVPDGYVFLDTADTAKLQALEKDLGGSNQYFFAPEDFHWQAFFTYRADGYVKDDDKIDAEAILKNISEGTERANQTRRERGYDEMQVLGWQTRPHYDTQTHHLEWAILGKNKQTNDQVVNFNTRILGRGGVMSVVLVSSPESLSPAISEIKDKLGGFDYQPGQRYAEYKPGDKIAQYGLAALITGGAAAVAVKTGFWKVIVGALVAGWKFIVAGVAALFGGITRLFKRNRSQGT
jgi:uncharacterized membrane-anchored protein